MKKIEIIVNGEKKEIDQELSIRGLLDSMQIKSKMIVVEKNRTIVNKENYSDERLNNGDTLEIIGFFGGG